MSYRIISADSHINEPPTLWHDRLPANLRSSGFRVVDCDDGGQGWTAEGSKPASYGLGAVSQAHGDFTKIKERSVRFSDLPPGNYDPIEHLKDQDRDGVVASVIFPGQGANLPKIKDKELRLASYRAYNDWLVEEFAAGNRQRIIPLAMIPADDDIEDSVAELRRSIEKGHRGGIIPTYPFERSYSDAFFDPLWAAASEANFPLHFHRVIARGRGAFVATTGAQKAASVAGIALRFFATMEPIAYMLFGGVFQRHPELRVVSAESNFGWLPFFTQTCDDQWERQRHWSESKLTERPSFYCRRQVYLTFMDDVVGLSNLAFVGSDNFMFASDYPHSVSLWPESRSYIDRQMKAAGVSDEDRAKLVFGNASRLYKISVN